MSFEINASQAQQLWQSRGAPALPAVPTQSPKVTPESVATSAEAASAKADATISKWSAKVGFDDAQSSSHAERVALAATISAQLSAADKQQFANEMLAASGGTLNYGLRGVMAAPTPATAGPVAAPQPTAPTAPASSVSTAPLTSSDPQQTAKLADIMNFLDRIKALLGNAGNAIADQVLKVASAIKVPEGGAISDADFKTLTNAVATARQQTITAVGAGAADMVKQLSAVSVQPNLPPDLKAAVNEAKTAWQNLVATIAAGKPIEFKQVEDLDARTDKVTDLANKWMTANPPVKQARAATPTPVAATPVPVAAIPAPVAAVAPPEFVAGTSAIPTAGAGVKQISPELTSSSKFAEADKLAAEEKRNAEQAEEVEGADR